jgi:cystathionine gamma-synthase
MANWGVTFSQARMQDLAAVERTITPKTKLVWVETPSNPMLAVTDLQAVISLAKKAGASVACDNTVGTPMLQRPLELGADISMHSVTKFLSGHSDVLSGALVFRETGPLLDRIRHIQQQSGGVPSPFECWLTLRGLQSFPYRMRGICASAQRVAEFLSSHPKLEAVHYPGLPKHPGHDIAAAQMSGGFGGLMSMQVKGGQAEAFKVLAAVKIFTHATSLGGTHSLIEHRASVEGPDTRSPVNLLRLSIGLEHPDDLIEDLGQALNAV